MPRTIFSRRPFAPAAFRLALALLLLALARPALAVEIQEVVSPKGIEAWLVEDRSVPLVAIRFAFRGGSAQDPAGKEGLANLMTGLFDEGAGGLDGEAFRLALDDAGAEMRFSAGADALYGSMRVLAETRERGFELLRLAVNEPRFEAEPFERIRAQVLAGLADRAVDPEAQADIRWDEALWGDHAYARREEGTTESLAAIAPSDLRTFHAKQFARENLVVAVVGAIDAETLARELDRVFGALPERATLLPVPDVEPTLAQEIRFPAALPQSTIRLAFPGVERDSPDFFAAYLMVEILGGDGLTSRLFTEVREKRGLAYGVGASLSNREHAAALVIGTATAAERADESLAVIRDTLQRMATEGPTAAELAAVKRYLIGAYAINNLGSSTDVASTLVELQLDSLGIDYMDRRAGLIEAVTLEDAKRLARELLLAEPAVMVVGPAAESAAP